MKCILIAGPTASGKSRLALDLAEKAGGIVVNADSMQVYSELRILSARPTMEGAYAIPHRLYGHVGAGERYSVGRWLADVRPILAEAESSGQALVIVGGTGLYFRALTEGLAAIPPVPAEVRESVLAKAEGATALELHARLAVRDPEDAAGIRPSDRARVIRALEVFEATGRSIAAWRRSPAMPLVDPATAERFVLDPDRARLHEQIGERAERMIAAGALLEAKAIGEMGLDRLLPAMKAIGLRELLDHLAGRSSLEEAVAGLKTETRRYAKRQVTWFRNQMADWPRRELRWPGPDGL